MRRTISTILLLAGAAISLGATVVSGRVFSSEGPVSGAVISDGVNVVTTAPDGTYTIKTKCLYGYVFLSVPSGYEVPVKGIIPQFFQYIDKKAKSQIADFELTKVDQTKCRIVVYNDIHLNNNPKVRDLEQARKGFLSDVASYLPTLSDQRLYAITLGDMTTDSRWYRQNFALPEYLEQLSDFPCPVFHSTGNHDNDIRGGGGDFNSSSTFRKVIGPNFYSLNIGAFHLIALDNIIYDNPVDESDGYVHKVNTYHKYIDAQQLSWLKKDIATVSPETPVIIYMHAPFNRVTGIKDGVLEFHDDFSDEHPHSDVLYFLKDFKRIYLLSGHTHENYYVQESERILEHNNVGVAGSSWSTEGLFGINMSRDGVPCGYSIYEIDGDNLSWYYKPVGMNVEDCQFRAYDMNTVPDKFGVKDGRSNVIWLNVFNWDPEWKIEAVEDGKPLDVTRKWLKDPLYTAGVQGSELMDKGAFKPHANSHMFEIQALSADAPVEITVTDRFGRVFRQRMERPKDFSFEMPLGTE
ncbi:MAG: calcineurin-like phosphoesterase C-terminal domain-containing protein [Bacteroidales bacterium]|nr:calcineurin-like phosphoesterase C-terminal domain-containing protein [Bacteroidales bacterium]